MEKEKLKITILEFLRYVVVGGVAFIADFGSLYLFNEFVFKNVPLGIYISTALSFLIGLTVNYVLSLKFVFVQPKDIGKGRDSKSFIIFGIIGIIGLFLTELGMYIGCSLLKNQLDICLTWVGNYIQYDFVRYEYLIVKCIVTAVVLFWNYAARKLIIFR